MPTGVLAAKAPFKMVRGSENHESAFDVIILSFLQA